VVLVGSVLKPDVTHSSVQSHQEMLADQGKRPKKN